MKFQLTVDVNERILRTEFAENEGLTEEECMNMLLEDIIEQECGWLESSGIILLNLKEV
jgi:hypothetical protein